MTAEMVERVSRAIVAAESFDPDEKIYIGSGEYATRWFLTLPTARAAIQAITEMPDASIMAMCKAHDQEQSAQMGEPSPWEHYDCEDGQCANCIDFQRERIVAMRLGLAALGEPDA